MITVYCNFQPPPTAGAPVAAATSAPQSTASSTVLSTSAVAGAAAAGIYNSRVATVREKDGFQIFHINKDTFLLILQKYKA